jgi:cation:H+ antiporter
MIEFTFLPLWANFTLFILIAGIVWKTGFKLSVYAEIISDRTNTSKVLMGFVFLAVATQLPEIVTNSTAALQGKSALLLNSMFGGIVMQTAVLFFADISVMQHTLTYYAYNSANQLQGTMLVLALSIALVITKLGDIEVVYHIGLGAISMALLYLLTLFLLSHYEKNSQWKAIQVPEDTKEDIKKTLVSGNESTSTKTLILRSLGLALIILVSGVLLVQFADTIATQSGLGTSFIGASLLALSTSLPELSTAIAAVRLGSANMAISDIFGSNLIMIFLLLPSDTLYQKGLLLNQTDDSAQIALLAGIIVTVIYLLGLQMRSSKKIFGAGLDSWLVLTTYISTLFIFFNFT